MADPILIVGAGPTGLTAALELGRLGVPVRIIDKREAPATTSRAIGIQARTLELMAQRGLSDEMVRLGNKGTHGSVYGGGKRAFRLDYGRVDSGFPYMLFLSQAETERILREAVAAHGTTIEWRTTLVGIAQDALSKDPSPVTVAIETPDGPRSVATPWLISAEGAHSSVRTTLDLRFEGKALDEQYALGDLHVDGDLADSDFHIFSSEHGFMALFPMGGGHFRMIASNPLGDPGRGSPPTEEELQQVYDQRSPVPARLHDTTWTSWFRINSRMVSRLRVGRLLLGGDSAHIHSPAGAQGMNTGIQDMINLGWKLALVIRGEARDALLDSYEGDRLPVMRDVLFKTENLTEVIGTEHRIARLLFDHLGPWIGGAGIVQDQATNRMAQVVLGYRDGPLSQNQAHGGTLQAGDRVPQHRAVRYESDGGWRDGVVGDLLDPSGFVLLVALTDEATAPSAALLAATERARAPIRVVVMVPPADGDSFTREFGRWPAVFLVRPDGYLAVATPLAEGAAALGRFVDQWLTPTEAQA